MKLLSGKAYNRRKCVYLWSFGKLLSREQLYAKQEIELMKIRLIKNKKVVLVLELSLTP